MHTWWPPCWDDSLGRQTCCEVPTPSTFCCAAFARSEHKMHDPSCYCQHCLCFFFLAWAGLSDSGCCARSLQEAKNNKCSKKKLNKTNYGKQIARKKKVNGDSKLATLRRAGLTGINRSASNYGASATSTPSCADIFNNLLQCMLYILGLHARSVCSKLPLCVIAEPTRSQVRAAQQHLCRQSNEWLRWR